MNAARCLAWCVEYRGQYPDDAQTAAHVRDWLAASALTVANAPAHQAAIFDAVAWANCDTLTPALGHTMHNLKGRAMNKR